MEISFRVEGPFPTDLSRIMDTVRHTSAPVSPASVLTALVLCLTLLCTASGCLPAFGQAGDESSADGESTNSEGQPGGTESEAEQAESTEQATSDEEEDAAVAAEQAELLSDIAASDTRSIDELLEAIKVALKETKNQKPPKRKAAQESWRTAQESHFADGVLAATVLIEKAEASEGQKRYAWKTKAIFLYRAAEHGWPAFYGRLSRTVDQLISETDFTEEAEYASGLRVAHVCYKSDTKIYKAIELLTEHAKAFPEGKTCARLFLAFARKLEDVGKLRMAERTCEAAIWPLMNHPDVGLIRNHLAAIQEKTKWSKAGPTISSRSASSRASHSRSGPRDAVQIELERQVAAIRGMLPMKVDSATTLTDITPGYHTINYRYTVTMTASQIERHKDTIRQKVTKLARSISATREILEAGVVMNYAYYDRSGKRLLSFSVSKRS